MWKSVFKTLKNRVPARTPYLENIVHGSSANKSDKAGGSTPMWETDFEAAKEVAIVRSIRICRVSPTNVAGRHRAPVHKRIASRLGRLRRSNVRPQQCRSPRIGTCLIEPTPCVSCHWRRSCHARNPLNLNRAPASRKPRQKHVPCKKTTKNPHLHSNPGLMEDLPTVVSTSASATLLALAIFLIDHAAATISRV